MHFRWRCSSIQSHPALGCPRILVPAAKLDSHLSLIALRTRNGLGKVPTAEVTVGGLPDQIAGAARRDGTSFRKPCLAETVDKHLSLPLTATSYPFRYSKIGLNLKELGHRLPNFCISPQVRESCREAAISRCISRFGLESVPGRGNRFVETTNADECNAHSCKT